MASELLDYNTTTVKQASGVDGINDFLEMASSPATEVFRVTSNEDGDWFFCRKINRVQSIMVQNHGATFATGVSVDPPKLTITESASSAASAKITIGHTSTRECFSIIVIGEL